MSIRRIDRDVSRFNDKLKQAVKSNFKNYISHTEKYKINGKTITIPVRRIEIPRFHYGQNGGVGQGEGEWGDSFNHGDKSEEPTYDSEFTLEEIAKMLGEELELPLLEPKNYGSVEYDQDKYKSITREGPRSQRSFKRTMKEALKRTIASGEYDPENPIIIPEKPDFRHRYAPPIKTPDTKAAVIYLMDSSGSMGAENTIDIAKNTFFWIDLWIQKHYNKTERRYVHYDTGAREVEKNLFFQVTASGGTDITAGLELTDKIISKDFNSSDWNIYLVHATDGDYTSSLRGDWELKDNLKKVLNKVNAYFVEQINPERPSALMYDTFLKKYFLDKYKEQIRLASIEQELEQIPQVLRTFFGKVKAS